MGLNNLEDCIKNGLIKRMAPSDQRSILRARMWLLQAKVAKSAEIYDSCLLAAYETMFHAARALLIKDGYRERSHYCIARYVYEMYVKKGLLGEKIIEMIDHYRELRHDAAYEIEFEAGDTDAENAIKDAAAVLNAIEKLFTKN
jgi:uncharacterized protein (UPF0332 family)